MNTATAPTLESIAADMGVSVAELDGMLSLERELSEPETPALPLRGRGLTGKGREIGHVSSRAPSEIFAARAETKATLATRGAAGRAILSDNGHRTDVVIVTNRTETKVMAAFPVGSVATAGRRMRTAAANRDKLSAKLASLDGAYSHAVAGGTATTIWGAQSAFERVAGAYSTACRDYSRAVECYRTARDWEDTPDVRVELTVTVEPDYFDTHPAPIDRMPRELADHIRPKPTRAPHDPIPGELARVEWECARDAREIAWQGRIIHDVVTSQPEYRDMEYKARRAAAARDRRARARRAK